MLDLRWRLTNADRRERHPSPCLLLISHPLPVPRSCCSPADETQDTHSRLWRGEMDSRSGNHIPPSTFQLRFTERRVSSSPFRLTPVVPAGSEKRSAPTFSSRSPQPDR